jgi:hypothetical protein
MGVCSVLNERYIFPDELLRDELSFLLSPILLKNKIATIFSPASVGKSTFTYQVVRFLLKCQVVNKVLCIFSDADTTNAEFQALVREYFDRNDLSKSRFIPVLPDQKFWKDFRKSVEDGSLVAEGIDFIIVDSLEQFFELAGLDFHRSVGVFFGILRRLAMQGVSILILHHTNKSGVEFSGRSVILNQSDVVYRLRRAGKFKWFGDALKHRGAKELNGKIDFYAELTEEGIEFSTDMVDDRYGYVVHLIKQVLAEKGRLRQYELVREVKKEAKKEDEKAEIGINKIREALAKYDGVYWHAERGEKNALEYELIVQVKVEEKDQDRDKILLEIEEMIKKKILFADDMPSLLYNGKEYKVFTDIAKDVPTSVLKEYLQRIKGEFAGVEEVAEDF